MPCSRCSRSCRRSNANSLNPTGSDKLPGEYAPLARAAEQSGFAVVTAFNDLWFQPALPALLEIARSTRHVRASAIAVGAVVKG